MTPSIIGKQYGDLTVTGELGRDAEGNRVVLVRCICGTEFVFRRDRLRPSRKCEQCRLEVYRRNASHAQSVSRQRHDLTNLKIRKLTVSRKATPSEIATTLGAIKGRYAYWWATCDCGAERLCQASRLKRGQITACEDCARASRGPKAGGQIGFETSPYMLNWREWLSSMSGRQRLLFDLIVAGRSGVRVWQEAVDVVWRERDIEAALLDFLGDAEAFEMRCMAAQASEALSILDESDEQEDEGEAIAA